MILEKEGESPHVCVRFPLSIFEDRYMGSHPNVPVKSARVMKSHAKALAKLWITEKNAPQRWKMNTDTPSPFKYFCFAEMQRKEK